MTAILKIIRIASTLKLNIINNSWIEFLICVPLIAPKLGPDSRLIPTNGEKVIVLKENIKIYAKEKI